MTKVNSLTYSIVGGNLKEIDRVFLWKDVSPLAMDIPS